jgi:hypothetical protein
MIYTPIEKVSFAIHLRNNKAGKANKKILEPIPFLCP